MQFPKVPPPTANQQSHVYRARKERNKRLFKLNKMLVSHGFKNEKLNKFKIELYFYDLKEIRRYYFEDKFCVFGSCDMCHGSCGKEKYCAFHNKNARQISNFSVSTLVHRKCYDRALLLLGYFAYFLDKDPLVNILLSNTKRKNLIDIYSKMFGIFEQDKYHQLANNSFLTNPTPVYTIPEQNNHNTNNSNKSNNSNNNNTSNNDRNDDSGEKKTENRIIMNEFKDETPLTCDSTESKDSSLDFEKEHKEKSTNDTTITPVTSNMINDTNSNTDISDSYSPNTPRTSSNRTSANDSDSSGNESDVKDNWNDGKFNDFDSYFKLVGKDACLTVGYAVHLVKKFESKLMIVNRYKYDIINSSKLRKNDNLNNNNRGSGSGRVGSESGRNLKQNVDDIEIKEENEIDKLYQSVLTNRIELNSLWPYFYYCQFLIYCYKFDKAIGYYRFAMSSKEYTIDYYDKKEIYNISKEMQIEIGKLFYKKQCFAYAYYILSNINDSLIAKKIVQNIIQLNDKLHIYPKNMNNNVGNNNISVNLKIDKREHKHPVTFPSIRMNNKRHNNNRHSNNTSNTIGNNNSNNNYRYHRNRNKNGNTYDGVKNTLGDATNNNNNNNNNRNWNNTNRTNHNNNHCKGRITNATTATTSTTTTTTTTTIRSPTSTTSTVSSASTTSATSPRTNKAKINMPQARLIQTIPPPQTRKQIHNQAMRAAMKRPTTPRLTLPGQKSYDGKMERHTNKYMYGSNSFDHLRHYNGNSNNLKTSISPMSQDSCTTVSVNSSPASSSDTSTFASVGNSNRNNHNQNTANTTTDDNNSNSNQTPTPKKLWRLKSGDN